MEPDWNKEVEKVWHPYWSPAIKERIVAALKEAYNLGVSDTGSNLKKKSETSRAYVPDDPIDFRMGQHTIWFAMCAENTRTSKTNRTAEAGGVDNK